ncbi:MAG TPA: sigma-70 family RNA polymerase sigma factor [Streptosporangiaceae bacterium]|nr:sigma-70 family RNA polymerase sigma factor [Streptosporangiaceae bacterium]
MASNGVGRLGEAPAARQLDGETGTGGAAEGSSVAALFREHHVGLVRLATLLVRSPELADDVVQDVFTSIQARPVELARPEAALPYLRAAVLNRCRSVLRRQAVAQRFGVLRDADWGLTQLSAEADAIRAEDRRQVLAALASLPRRRREVLVLRYYLGLSESEISQTLGISQGTVKSTAARGIAALARKLGEEA